MYPQEMQAVWSLQEESHDEDMTRLSNWSDVLLTYAHLQYLQRQG